MRVTLTGLMLVLPFVTATAGVTLGNVTERVTFAPGSSSTTVSGAVTADEFRDYVLAAKAGQTLTVKLATRSNLYFNVLPPESDEAIFVGQSSADASRWSGKLPADGDYIVRLYALGTDRSTGKHPFECTFSVK